MEFIIHYALPGVLTREWFGTPCRNRAGKKKAVAQTPELDVITLGRSSVDLYGQQIGGRLEDMASFAKAVGGSPTNIAVGAARLGLRAGAGHWRKTVISF